MLYVLISYHDIFRKTRGADLVLACSSLPFSGVCNGIVRTRAPPVVYHELALHADLLLEQKRQRRRWWVFHQPAHPGEGFNAAQVAPLVGG